MAGEITQLLERAAQGDQQSLGAVFDALYPELRRLAAGRLSPHAESTLSPTILVHELYEKFIGAEDFTPRQRSHFFACAARAMRQIIVDHARARNAEKRGQGFTRVTYRDGDGREDSLDVLSLDDAMESLREVEPDYHGLVELRFFAGLTVKEISEATGVPVRTLNRQWRRARALLQVLLDDLD
ncbi:MAG: ECF-type sigma factor [Xanthomonadales bacterium]|nr:ECF-type sigma factor [Xanthomonadales bacterium]